jgi:subtilisin-like proprotein convertase family protein
MLLAALLASLAFASAPASAAEAEFSNATPIAIPDHGIATPYPSTIDVSGQTGRITDVRVALRGFTHTHPEDVDILLVAPNGAAAVVMSNACGAALQNANFIFTESAADGMPRLTGCDGIFYRPTNYFFDDHWPGLPDGPYDPDFSKFVGGDPNGTWSLYVFDQSLDDQGKINLGWSLTVDTVVPDATVPGNLSGTADPYPIARTVSGLGGVITDVNVSMAGLYHESPTDLEILLVGPQGQKVKLMAGACASPLLDASFTFDDQAAAGMPQDPARACFSGGSYKPTDYRPGDQLPAPAPPGPYATELSAFDGTQPNGEWRLYVNDVTPAGGNGFFTDRFTLAITTRPKAKVGFAQTAVDLTEGQSRQLTLTRTAATALGAGSVKVTSSSLSATSGSDFRPVSARVNFAAGQTTKRISVDALADAVREPPETFALTISDATGDAQPAKPPSAVVTIRDATPDPTGQSPGVTIGNGGTSGPGNTPGTNSGGARNPGRGAPVIGNVRVTRTAITYTLSEPARVTLRVRRTRGKRSVAVATLHGAGRAGLNRVLFKGRIGRHALRPGRYQLVVVAVDATGNRAISGPRSFRIT